MLKDEGLLVLHHYMQEWAFPHVPEVQTVFISIGAGVSTAPDIYIWARKASLL
jgi:hypothetical protein